MIHGRGLWQALEQCYTAIWGRAVGEDGAWYSRGQELRAGLIMSDGGEVIQATRRPGVLRREAGKLIAFAIAVAALVVFIVENSRTVRVTFLFWRVTTSLAWALLLAGALGFVACLALTWLRGHVRRH